MQNILKFLKDHAIQAYAVIDNNGNVLDFSNNLKKYLSINQDILQVIRPLIWIEDFHKFENFLSNVYSTGHQFGTFEINTSQNRFEKVNIIGVKYNKEKEYFIGIGKKISNLLDDKNSVENQINFLKDFSIIFNGFFIEFDTNLVIKNILGDTSEFFGIEREEFLKQRNDFAQFICSDYVENFKIIHNPANVSKNVEEITYRLKKSDGTCYWVKELFVLVSKKEQHSILSLFYNIEKEKMDFDKLFESKKQLLELANHLELTREQERKNMAREIHDEIGHALTSLKLEINLLLKKKFLREEKLESKLGEMQKHIEETIRMLQRISAQLRPSILDHFGLIAALEWQAKEFQRQTSIRCKYSIPEEDIELSEQKTVAVFRIFQEILTNIARHSQASRVDVFLTIENNILDLKVSDNGIGIRKEDLESPKSLGLIGMKERANLVEGKFSISSILNIGTTVQLVLNLN